MHKKQYLTYVVECADGTLYTGYTINVEKRIWEHNNSQKGAKYTKTRRPVKLKYVQYFNTKSEAMKHEYKIKKLTKLAKEKLIKNNEPKEN